MSTTALPPEALPADVAAGWARPMVERQLAVLGRLAEAGLEIAVALEGQAKGGDVVVQGDVALAYSRVARAVRQTIMLQSRLIEALQERESAEAGRKAAARARAARLLSGVIDDDRPNDDERAERLAGEAAERLRAEDFGDLLSRPFGEAVALICKDLGLAPDWLKLAEDCYDAEAALLRKPGKTPPAPEDEGPIEYEVQWLGDDSTPNSS